MTSSFLPSKTGRYLVLGFLFSIALGAIFILRWRAPLQAGLVVDGTGKIDFGDVLPGTPITHEFRLINRAMRPVAVTRIQQSCTCTSANVDHPIIAPSDACLLKVVVSPNGPGRLLSEAAVQWTAKSGVTGVLKVYIAANITKPIRCDPVALDLGEVDVRGGAIETELQLALLAKGWGCDKLMIEGGRIDVSQRQIDGNKVILKAKFDPKGLPIGAYKGEITVVPISNGQTVVGQIAIPVRAKLIGPFIAEPRSIYFGIVPPDGEKRGEFSIKATNGGKIGLESIRADGEGVEVIRLQQADAATLRFSVTSKGKRGQGGGFCNILAEVRVDDRLFLIKTPIVSAAS